MGGVMATVKTDLKLLKKIEKSKRYLEKHAVLVGYIGKEANRENDGTKVIDYAVILEEGSEHMKARPFFFIALKSAKSKRIITKEQKEILKDVLKGDLEGKQALKQLGMFMVQRVKDTIIRGDFEPLKPETIKRKKRNKGNILRENDFLLNSIAFEIIKA